MAVSLKHAFTSTVADDADTSLVRPSNWNAEHELTLGSGKLLGRSSSGTGAAEEITVGTGLSLSSGTLSATGGGGGTPGGSDTQVQYNSSGSFAGSSKLVFDSTNGNIKINNQTTLGYFPSYMGGQGEGLYFSGGGSLTPFELSLNSGSDAGYYDSTELGWRVGSTWYTIKAPSTGTGADFILPPDAGSSGQVLTTNGSGVTSWTYPAKSSPPSTATSTGTAGEIRYDSDYVYICVATNTWKRAALSTW